MKSLFFKLITLALALFSFLCTMPSFAQNFQCAYGTSLDNSFSKVIKSGSDYYVLGQDEPSNGALLHATVTRLDAFGQQQWTLRLDIASKWNDAVLTPSGSLLVVGYTLPTLPVGTSNKSLMGLITPAGGFSWVRSYDVTGREAFTRIVESPAPEDPLYPYYVLGAQHDANGNELWDDIVLLNVNDSGAFKWKKYFPSVEDDEFDRDLEVMPNGDLILAGNLGSQGVIIRTDNTGAFVNAGSIENFSYADVARASGSGFYAVGSTVPGVQFRVYLMKFDNNLLSIWDARINGLTAVSQVWEANGSIYVTGTGVFNSTSRAVMMRFTDTGIQPTLDWVRYLDTGEFSYTGGSSWLLPPNQIAFVDGRAPDSGSFGKSNAFISVSDLELSTCMTQESVVSVNPVALVHSSPFVPPIVSDILPLQAVLTATLLNWQQASYPEVIVLNSGWDNQSSTVISTVGTNIDMDLAPNLDWLVTADLITPPPPGGRPADIVEPFGTAWSPPFPNSQWISGSPTRYHNQLPGTPIPFTYELCFNLPQYFSNPFLSMQLRADERIEQVFLGGFQIYQFISQVEGGFNGPPLVLNINNSAYFQPGQNCLTVVYSDLSGTVTGLNIAGTMTYCKTWQNVPTTDLSSPQQIRLFPNPTSGESTLEFDQTIPTSGSIVVSDLLGRTISQEIFETGSNQHRISLGSAPSGIYLVRVLDGGKVLWSGKLVKE